ncbi:MAG TPA: M28 family peptidase [Terriglobales bacterium]
MILDFVKTTFEITRKCLPAALCAFFLSLSAYAQVQFHAVDRSLVETRLKSYVPNNADRAAGIKKFFSDSGCKNLTEQAVPKLPPNVICILPGQSDQIIIVGAHTDKVAEAGEGVVDNWSGASLLSSLYESVNSEPRRHTYMFIGFTGEEKGLLGSKYYVEHLTPAQRAKIVAMVNMDTLGVSPTKVWATHADQSLLTALDQAAGGMKLPLAEVDVDKLGDADSESFASAHIPRITIHSITQETWPILHSDRDRLSAVKMDDYYNSYLLIAGYLAYLDTYLSSASPTAHTTTAH